MQTLKQHPIQLNKMIDFLNYASANDPRILLPLLSKMHQLKPIGNYITRQYILSGVFYN